MQGAETPSFVSEGIALAMPALRNHSAPFRGGESKIDFSAACSELPNLRDCTRFSERFEAAPSKPKTETEFATAWNANS